jgi:hypothetical protein
LGDLFARGDVAHGRQRERRDEATRRRDKPGEGAPVADAFAIDRWSCQTLSADPTESIWRDNASGAFV